MNIWIVQGVERNIDIFSSVQHTVQHIRKLNGAVRNYVIPGE